MCQSLDYIKPQVAATYEGLSFYLHCATIGTIKRSRNRTNIIVNTFKCWIGFSTTYIRQQPKLSEKLICKLF